jgi:hypothetical protein
MIQLSALVGALLNEFAIARTKAALFSAQMAADFRDEELLEELPIPVYRISGAEVTLPFAVANISVGGGEDDRERRGEKGEEERRPSAPTTVEPAMYVHVEVNELRDVEQVSMLKLELEEVTLSASSTGEEVDLESGQAMRGGAQADTRREDRD